MLRPIKNKKQYQAALARCYELMQKKLKARSEEGDEFEVLLLLISQYEDKHYPIPPPTPIEAIKFRLEQMGMKVSDLNSIIGYRSRKSEILNGKRKLSLRMIRALHDKLNIPAETLIAAY
jgi:HTH-type transcriptional regulator/antitoxin HigA